jgi:hypothetical protein
LSQGTPTINTSLQQIKTQYQRFAQDIRERIHHYDELASQPQHSLGFLIAQQGIDWAATYAAIDVTDAFINRKVFKSEPSQSYFSAMYGKALGLESHSLRLKDKQQWKKLLTADGIKAMGQVIRFNFQNCLSSPVRAQWSLPRFLKYVLWTSKLDNYRIPFRNGQYLRLLYTSWLTLKTVNTIIDSYQQSQKTNTAFKLALNSEIRLVGYSLGQALSPFSGISRKLAGGTAACILSGATLNTLEKVSSPNTTSMSKVYRI